MADVMNFLKEFGGYGLARSRGGKLPEFWKELTEITLDMYNESLHDNKLPVNMLAESFSGDMIVGSGKFVVKPATDRPYELENLRLLADGKTLYVLSLDHFKTVPLTDFSNVITAKDKISIELGPGNQVITSHVVTDINGIEHKFSVSNRLMDSLTLCAESGCKVVIPAGTTFFRFDTGNTFKKMVTYEEEHMTIVTASDLNQILADSKTSTEKLEAALEEKEKLSIELEKKQQTIEKLTDNYKQQDEIFQPLIKYAEYLESELEKAHKRNNVLAGRIQKLVLNGCGEHIDISMFYKNIPIYNNRVGL